MKLIANPYRGTGLAAPELDPVPWPSVEAERPRRLLGRCPEAGETPLVEVSGLGQAGKVFVKDERGRMGLGSFKALGAAYVIARDAEAGAARGRSYVTASAGNHGLSLAAGAAAFGARAVICLAETVPEAFAGRLRDRGARVVRRGATYEDSMEAAAEAARRNGWTLLSDSSWQGYTDIPHTLMEGYLVIMAEVADRIGAPPSHIFLQAGVGGLAGAAAAYARRVWGDGPVIVVVEPDAAPALAASIAAGRPVTAPGPASVMGRLDCKTPSLIALKGLARDADHFATISENEALCGAEFCTRRGLVTTPSGAAGIAALLAAVADGVDLGLNGTSRVLTILSEGPE